MVKLAMGSPLARFDDVGRHWVYGLTWFAVVGTGAVARVRLRARQMGASHYLLGGRSAQAGGCVWLPRRLRPRRGQFSASAAQQVATLLAPQCGVAVLSIASNIYWLIAIQEGAVLADGDALFASFETASQALEAMCAQQTSLQRIDAQQILQCLQVDVLPTARLQPLSHWSVGQYAVAALCLGGASLGLLRLVVAPSTAVAPLSTPDTERMTVPDDLALATVTHLCPVPMLNNLYGLMGRLAGWELRHAQCAATDRGWQCEAIYRSSSDQVSNISFLRATPAGMTSSFHGLDEARLAWQIAHSEQACRFDQGQHLALRWLDTLRPLRTLLEETWVGPAELVMASAAGLPRSRHALRLRGPLRSFVVLPLATLPAHWTHAQLRIQHSAQVSLATSQLELTLEGTFDVSP